MPYDVSEIKSIRKKMGLTQAELANKSGVSQSLIAKIEAGLIDPAYSKAQKIINALGSIKAKEEQKAFDVMEKKIFNLSPSAGIREAIELMKKHNISQIPVMQDGKCVGLISEAVILDALIEKKPKTVGDIMTECPPIISKNASINVVSDMLRHYPTILVSENGKIIGIITKSDILGKLKF